ncbi:hypothetical protein IAU59_004618 [Kwoniella sp. CBS 9459]
MHNPLDEPSLDTPRSATPDTNTNTNSETQEQHHQPLAIEAPPAGTEAQAESGEVKQGADDDGEVTTLDLGEGNVVKLDKLGPMIINSDGTLSRIQNWQDLHPIEQERTVRLLVKKRNVVRLQKLANEDNGGESSTTDDQKQQQPEKLSILQDSGQ